MNASGKPGCCDNCDGSGTDIGAIESGGRCWDCRGTGHCHDPEEECEGLR